MDAGWVSTKAKPTCGMHRPDVPKEGRTGPSPAPEPLLSRPAGLFLDVVGFQAANYVARPR